MKKHNQFKLLLLTGIWFISSVINADHYCRCDREQGIWKLSFVQTDIKTGEIIKTHILDMFSPRNDFDESIFERSLRKRCEKALRKHPSCS